MIFHITRAVVISWLGGAIAAALSFSGLTASGATLGVGDLAPNFTLPKYRTGEPVSLTNFAGSVVVLEFFHPLCSVCRQAAPAIKSGIHDYYAAQGAAVKLISVNVSGPTYDSDTDEFIATYGLDFVVNDREWEVFESYENPPHTPLFVVINGRTSTGRPRQWEILFRQSGYYANVTVPNLRAAIERALDVTPPTVNIVSPAAGTQVGQSSVVLTGTATDNMRVAAVEYRLINTAGKAPFQLAEGTTNWTASVSNLALGTNIIRARARDWQGNLSALAETRVIYLPRAVLTLVTNGGGDIEADLRNLNLIVGRDYTLKAVPAPEYVFYNWTAGLGPESLEVVSTQPEYTFTMQTGLWVQANFVISPFQGVRGTYHGLYYDPTGAEAESSGAFRLTVTKRGLYSAEVQHELDRHSHSGQFDLEGKASFPIVCACMAARLEFQLDLDGSRTNYLTGRVRDLGGKWEAMLLGDLAPDAGSAASPYQGKYTVVIPGTHDPARTDQPAGDGYGTVIVDAAGRLSFSASLADGRTLTHGSQVSSGGYWPLYVPLYARGEGALLSWVQLRVPPPPAAPLRGDVALWVRPANSNAAYFPDGFELPVSVMGSKYLPAGPVLPFSAGRVSFIGGGLPSNIVHEVTLTASNTLLSRPALAMSLTRSNGVFGGTVRVPGTTERVSFGGVVVQGHTNGLGYFRRGGQSGWVVFEPMP
jgi:peroxiredoxin